MEPSTCARFPTAQHRTRALRCGVEPAEAAAQSGGRHTAARGGRRAHGGEAAHSPSRGVPVDRNLCSWLVLEIRSWLCEESFQATQHRSEQRRCTRGRHCCATIEGQTRRCVTLPFGQVSHHSAWRTIVAEIAILGATVGARAPLGSVRSESWPAGDLSPCAHPVGYVDAALRGAVSTPLRAALNMPPVRADAASGWQMCPWPTSWDGESQAASCRGDGLATHRPHRLPAPIHPMLRSTAPTTLPCRRCWLVTGLRWSTREIR